MPRVKNKPKQKESSLPTVFENDEPKTSTEAHSHVPTDPIQAFELFSKSMETAKFATLPIFDTTADQVVPPLGFDKPATPSFFLPERVSSQPIRDRDREIVNCPVCQKAMRRGSLREHLDRHGNTGKFFCDLCGKNFSRASAREKHIRTHTGERPFKCNLCPKAYRQKVHLNEHMRSHSGERPFVCRLCGFSLASKSLLNRHLRTHGVQNGANDAPGTWLRTDAPKSQVLAAAEAVGRSFDSISAESPETIHITALNAVATAAAIGRKHLCPECPAGFPTIQALRSHRTTTHGLVSEHNCEHCSETFTSKKALKIHLRTVHRQVCPLCQEVMPQRRRWVLEVHFREQHPGISAESVIGPSPLSIAAAASYLRRTKSNQEKETLELSKLAPSLSETSEPKTEPEVVAYDEEMEEEDSSQSSLIKTLKKLEKNELPSETVIAPVAASKEDVPLEDSSKQSITDQ